MNSPDPTDLPPFTLKAWYIYLWQHRTTVLGYATAIITAVAAAPKGVFPEAVQTVASGLAVLCGVSVAGVGHYNNARLKAMAAGNAAPAPEPAPEPDTTPVARRSTIPPQGPIQGPRAPLRRRP